MKGIYGLQRAFKIVGAKYVLMSLWQVNDVSSRKLMTEFYGHLLDGKEVHTALKAAQATMKEDYAKSLSLGWICTD